MAYHQVPYDPYQASAPLESPSVKAFASYGDPRNAAASPVNDATITPTYSRRDLPRAFLYFLVAQLFTGISAFGIYTATTPTYPFIWTHALSGAYINANTISILVAGVATVLHAWMTYAFVSVTRRWMYVTRDRPHSSDEWEAISNGFYLPGILQSRRIYRGWCSVAIALGALNSVAIAGVLVPSTGGATILAPWTYPTMVDNANSLFFNDATTNNAQRGIDFNLNNFFPAATFAGLYNGVFNTTQMPVEGFAQPQRADPYHSGPFAFRKLAASDGGVVQPLTTVTTVGGCGPTVSVNVSCETNHGSQSSFNSVDGSLSYHGYCGDGVTKIGTTLAGVGAWSQACNSNDPSTVLVDYYIAGDPGMNKQPVSAINCQVKLAEINVDILYDVAEGYFAFGRPCGGARELPSRVSLALAQAVSGALVMSPNSGGISSLVNPIISILYEAPQAGDGTIDEMIREGFLAAAQAAYTGLALARSTGDVPTIYTQASTDAEIAFQAYTWSSNRPKGIAFSLVLAMSALFMWTATFSAINRHIRYDPSNWVQTLYIALGSRMDVPAGLSSGSVPSKLRKFDLNYGIASDTHLAFLPRPAPPRQ
jgi:hypothetical protein